MIIHNRLPRQVFQFKAIESALSRSDWTHIHAPTIGWDDKHRPQELVAEGVARIVEIVDASSEDAMRRNQHHWTDSRAVEHAVLAVTRNQDPVGRVDPVVRNHILCEGADDVIDIAASPAEWIARVHALFVMRRAPRVLIVEDEARFAEELADILRRDGKECILTAKGEEAIRILHSTIVDAVILDRELADDTNGLEVARRLRAAAINTPVLFLTAHNTSRDRLDGLKIGGALDYIGKDFLMKPDELVLRVNNMIAVERRAATVSVGALSLHQQADRISWRGQPLKSTKQAVCLLSFLLERHGVEIPNAPLQEALGFNEDQEGNLRTALTRMRAVLRDAGLDPHTIVQKFDEPTRFRLNIEEILRCSQPVNCDAD